MVDRPRFGPAGVPPVFRVMKATLQDVPNLLREEGLDAFEYEAVRWGKKPQIRMQDAEKLGVACKASDVWLSMHGSYFINLCGGKDIVEASKERLIACATAASWMNAHVVAFHIGYYSERSKKESFRNSLGVIQEVVESLRTLGIRSVKLGPETSGKHSQLGSLEEIIEICQTVEQTQPVIDWAHLHARRGGFKSVGDFRQVLLEIESGLGTEVVRNLHCHFSRIEFTLKGEKRHHILDEKRYGPDFVLLAKAIIDLQLNPVIICETSLQDIDAMKMRDIFQNELQTKPVTS